MQIKRSDQREAEYEKYAKALSSENGSKSPADMFGSGRPVSYQQADASSMPTMMSDAINLSEIGGQRKVKAEENRPKFSLAQNLGDDFGQEMSIRSRNRRIMAGIPVVEDSRFEEIDRTTNIKEVENVSKEEVFASIDALLPAISKRPDGRVNRMAQKTASDLIKMLDIPEDQTDWFCARIASGVSNPNVFRRDLKMAVSSEEVS